MKIWAFAGHMVSMANTKLCPCGVRAALDNTYLNGHDFVPVTLHLEKLIWIMDHSSLTPVLMKTRKQHFYP